MKNYYFTFGQSHINIEGHSMRDYWVTVIASSYFKARDIFINDFSSIYMTAPNKWAFQYEEEKFEADLFPGGEFMVLDERN